MSKKHIVHVNQFHIKHNMKSPDDPKPVLTTRSYNSHDVGDEIVIRHNETGEELGRFVYNPDKPLGCGARVWFETRHNPEILRAG